ncbi:hypothetical protein M9H77_17615 [Catharanthus roseus]|uniref:Uncharacterized protein n=1 Tax=Catharanthus roseus TaxID=4058 RepID=A0ACC0B5C0_CATRO|nr:hypothetical protein M9H77_17615 [Catharanthus roseus]
MVVARESMLMIEATMEMGTSFLENMIVMETSLIKNIMELVTSLLILNLMDVLLMMLMGKISNEDPYDIMNEKSIEKEECNDLSENSRYFYCISTLCEKLEKDECSKEKEFEIEKSESTKENECFIEKQESIEKSKKKKKYKLTLFLLVQNFLTQNLENEESLLRLFPTDYNINKTINFFDPTFDLCFGPFLRGAKWNFFALIFYRNSLEHPCTWTSKLRRNHTMKSEDQGEIFGKELFQCHENSSLSPFLNPSLLFNEVSYEELKLFLASYISHVSIIGDVYVISFGGGLFLVMPCTSKCLSSYASLEDSLMDSGVKFNPSCYCFGMLNDASLVDPNDVGFELRYTLFDVLHDKSIGNYVEQCDYVFPWCFYEECQWFYSS